jgi:hypothetical protein
VTHEFGVGLVWNDAGVPCRLFVGGNFSVFQFLLT